ncbi:ABC transporter substrate-binding protein [Diplocloster hominis]|uniref:ABC transporter substrate-binding protein n=1 Tax=Diplocloster hominis TaxID=3079010 RepID=UPI0031BAED7D
MKIKKLTALCLTFTMAAGLLIGCSGQDTALPQENKEPAQTAATSDEQASGEKGDTGAAQETELTLQVGSNSALEGLEAVCDLAREKLGISVKIEYTVAGTDTDNIVKTRLATDELADILVYTPGALFASLNPSKYFIDISDQPFIEKLDGTYLSSVTFDDKVFGVPMAPSQAGAVMYSKSMYQELGLTVPKTWDEFMKNCDTIKTSGKTAVLCSLGTGYTVQVPFLGDQYNLMAADPDFIKDYEAGTTKYADNDAGLRSFEKLAETAKYYNEDYLATTYDDACEIMANGEAGHWIMLTSALTNIYKLYGDKVNDIGVFAVPGDQADDNGLTVWMPNSIYGNINSDKKDAILRFMEFFLSDEALNAYAAQVPPSGPYCVKDYEYPENTFDAVKIDMQSYFDSGKTGLAAEFLTQVKGSQCTEICTELVTGQIDYKEAAASYDEDCKKQAQQLGLNWE